MSLIVMQATVDMYREKIAKLEALLTAATKARDQACEMLDAARSVLENGICNRCASRIEMHSYEDVDALRKAGQ